MQKTAVESKSNFFEMNFWNANDKMAGIKNSSNKTIPK